MRWVVCFLILLVMSISSANAQQQIPAGSLDKIQNVLADLCDYMWVANDEYFHSGDFDRCIITLRLITEINPHDTEAYSNGAWMMQNQNRDNDAELFLLEGIRNNPESAEMYYEIGFYYYMHFRFSDAVRYLEIAVTYDIHWRAWHLLAHAYELAGDSSSAFAIWLRMESLYPNGAVPKIQINRMLEGGKPAGIPYSTRE